jgi:putative ABC transport system permease protein
MLHRLIAYARGIGGRRRISTEVDEELAFHLEQETAANMARGLAPSEARRLALAALGGLTPTAEATREVRMTSFDTWRGDIRHAGRSLRATPAFTVVALAVLTLSIGAATAIFSVVDAVVLRPLPFVDADRLVAIGELNVKTGSADGLNLVAAQNFRDWRVRQTAFTGIAAIGFAGVSVKNDGGREPETLEAQAVTADFFSVLGTEPLLGRPFTAGNEVNGRALVAVISYSLWQRRFGGAPDIVGSRLRGQLADFEIVGVMPPGFTFPVGAVRPTEVWLPQVFRDDEQVRGNDFAYRLQVIGRLRDGTSLEQAQAQMNQITAQLAAETPHWFENRVTIVEPLHEYVTRGVRTWMLMLLAAVGLVLLIACVNLANLMLVRASARDRELVIRAALGASRWDLLRVLLVESVLLSLGGAALGTLAAWTGVETLRAAIPIDVPRVAAIAIDLRVLAVTITVAVVCGLLFGSAPVLHLSRPSGGRALAPGTRANTATGTERWLRSGLVVMEVALAVILLVGAGLFLASFKRVAGVDLGLDPRHVLAVRIRPLVGDFNFKSAQERHPGMLNAILEQVRTIPGVELAALVRGGLPLRGDFQTIEVKIPGRPLPPGEDLDVNSISPDYFRTLGVPLREGRYFANDDRRGSEPVVIINEAAARTYFPGESALGRTIEFMGPRRIVGVVGSIRHEGPETSWRRQGFVPIEQIRATGATLVLRLSRDPGSVLPAVKSEIWSHFPDLALPDIQMLSQYLNALTAQRRLNMLLLNLFGALGVLIACAGIYGVMAYAAVLRTREIGIRMALGAVPGTILWSMLRQALVQLAAGLALGLSGAWVLAAFVAGFLFQVQPHDARIYLAVSATLIASGLAASYLPARRAARVDPLVALRVE